jgi:hypothetical protein
MPERPCDQAIRCFCDSPSDNPYSNYSAEAPDPITFFAFEYVQALPPLGAPDQWWATTAAPGPGFSPISQFDADDTAVNGANPITGWRSGGQPIPLYGNHLTQCLIACPEGFDPFVYEINPGTVIARTQEEADAIAASLCAFRGFLARECEEHHEVTVEHFNIDVMYDLSSSGIVAGRLAGFAVYFDGIIKSVPALAGPAVLVSEAYCCNATGDTGGYQLDAGFVQLGRWSDGVTSSSVGVDRDLRSMASDGVAIGIDIAVAGIIFRPGVGTSAIPGALTPASYRLNRSINDAHQCHVRNSTNVNAFRFNADTLVSQDISPVDKNGLSPNINPIAINASGACVGFYDDLLLRTCCYYNPSGGSASTQKIVSAGLTLQPNALSDNGMVVGQATLVPFKWTTAAGFSLIPQLPLTTGGAAQDVNSKGWIVGYMDSVAFIHRDGVTELLSDLLPAGSGFSSLEIAHFINNNDQIAGFGTYLGTPGTGFLLSL